MKKKVLGTVALSAIAAMSLASCGGGGKTTAGDGKTIEAIVLYKNNNGMTYRQADATKLVDGSTVKTGDLLPMWKELEKKFDVVLKDVGDYSQNSTKDAINKFMQDGYKGVGNTQVDLVMTMNSNTKDMANAGKLVALSDHLDEMPNFKAYLDSHPSIKAQLVQADGKIYNTPYFDGVDAVEKYFMMNKDYTKKLLDDANPISGLDTATTLSKNVYTAFYPNMAGQKITVVGTDGKAKEITVGSTTHKSAVDAQNAKGTLNGQNTAQALREYIDQAYRYNDELKALYPNRSDVFFSAAACYNVDDLTALFRAVKTNPQYLAGQSTINVVFPRSGEANRERAIVELAQFFGVRGISSEAEKLYFDKNGELQDARINEDTYKAIQKINQWYQEGLIVQGYENGFGSQFKNEWRKELLANGTGFASYDYTGTTSPYVKEGSKSESYTAVLPPVADWDVEKGPNGETLNDFFHFTEDTRALKDGGFAIPTTCDSSVLSKVIQIMDYMYTDEGADLQDYGPNTTAFRKAVTKYDEKGKRIDPNPASADDGVTIINNKTSVVISDAVLKDIAARKKNWNDYYRQFVGSTQGVGHIRSDGLDYQNMGEGLKAGMDNVSKAIAAGAMYIATTGTTGTFFSCAPSAYALTSSETSTINTTCKYFADLWKETSSDGTTGYTILVTDPSKISDRAIVAILAQENVKPVQDNYLTAYRRAYSKSLEYTK